MTAPDLSPFLNQENAARSNFAGQSAQNTFNRGRTRAIGNRNVADFRQGFQRQLPSFSAAWGQRGLTGGGVQSGAFGRAMQNFVGDYTKDLGRMTEDQFGQDQQYDFNQARFTADRDSAMTDIATRKAQLIAQTAQGIASLRPYLGG